ncbi:Receptor-like protein kinase FERONIA [Morella rubra]|uniref:non-specific serine/threonine protein kinase n=1 Tax=Morella rubra TaxID=262757 RepID=A0A6A1VFM4_9ROSI|nr:Receptor-like protein kinase FERONIA [Morella rubra]
MGPHSNQNLLNNLTWKLPVLDSGFNYLVRLHFCELETEITGPGQRQFIIYIDNATADDKADVMMWNGGAKDAPVYKDFVVRIQAGEPNLFIALHPREATDAINDAILNGIELLKLSDNGNLAGTNPPIVPSPAPDQQPASTANVSKISKTVSIAIGSVAGFSVLLALACCAALWKLRRTKHYGSYYPLSKCWCWPDHSKGKSTRTKASSLPDELCRHFSLEEIKIATSTFHEELIVGRGGFGDVYKGFIDHNDQGTMIVAIKRLNPESKQGAREFWREIDLLSQLRHVHLVSLIGYCDDDNEMILVYDYMTNGTLRDQLYDNVNDSIPWKQRLDICIGAARGLNYLHTGAKHPIIHRDVKTTNILLDEKWVAKVSDFGLSRMGLDNSAVIQP